MARKKRVLFLCVHNSARSILAEFLVNYFWRDQFIAQSAGLQATRVNPYTIRALEEIGVDTSSARSKSVEEFRGAQFDLVVTVCAPSEGQCPVWLGAGKRAHLPFDDPSRAQGSDEEILARFRAIRDEMREELDTFLAAQCVVE